MDLDQMLNWQSPRTDISVVEGCIAFWRDFRQKLASLLPFLQVFSDRIRDFPFLRMHLEIIWDSDWGMRMYRGRKKQE